MILTANDTSKRTDINKRTNKRARIRPAGARTAALRLMLAAALLLLSQFALAIAPVVSITAPLNNSRFGAPANITLSATASNAVGATISKVEFYRGKTLIGRVTTAPYNFNWSNVATGSYSITAKATNSANQTTTSAAVAVVVNNPPVVSLTAPANNGSALGLASTSLTATASDADGSISKVEFLNGSTVLGSDSSAPYSFNWLNVAPGSYSLAARATDNLGGVSTSAPIMFTVTNPLSVSLLAPANNSVFATGGVITFTANVGTAKAGTTISKVDFFQGSTLLNSDTSAPYSFDWSNVATGSYSLTAKVTDSQGLSQTSAPISVEVKIPGIPPTVSISSPVNNSSFIAPASIHLSASATASATLTAQTFASAAGPTNSISKVEYYQGALLLGAATTAPYDFTWANVGAGSYSITAKATDSRGLSQTSAPIALQVNALPNIAITTPADNTRFVAPANIAFSATASATGAGNSITQVAWYQGTTLLGTASLAPYGFTWPNVAAGSYSVTAKATDSNGLDQVSNAVNLIVDAPPSISLASPVDNSTFVAPATISLASNPVATGAGNSVVKVEYFQGTTLIASASSAPWAATWNNVATGSYNIIAKVTDSFGNSGSTAPVAVVVSDKIVSLAASPAYATAPATVTLDVSTNIAAGNIAKVEIFNGDNLITTLTASPWRFAWENIPVGAYTLRAKVTDNLAAVVSSIDMPVSITADTSKVYDIHVDHLDTPRMVTDGSGNAVWEWNGTPFGESLPNQNPGNTGAAHDFVLNLRFPGQVYDQETGLHYNYFRDYDPQSGRFLQSDLIGLEGGINTYAYANENPVSFFDLYGLAPGDKYPNLLTAGSQAIKDINARSISEDIEYAGRICMTKTNSCIYTKPRPGGRHWSDPGTCPKGTYSVADYHTHGAKQRPSDENFSSHDKYLNDKNGEFGFLGTPDGFIKLYIPDPARTAKGNEVVIGTTRK